MRTDKRLETICLARLINAVKSFHHILFLFRREEEKEEGLDVIDPESSTGTRKSDLVGWYLGEIQEEIESEEELVEKKVMVEKIIDRLVNQDQVF